MNLYVRMPNTSNILNKSTLDVNKKNFFIVEYNTSFESQPDEANRFDGWNGMNWIRLSGETPSSGTGPMSAENGEFFPKIISFFEKVQQLHLSRRRY